VLLVLITIFVMSLLVSQANIIILNRFSFIWTALFSLFLLVALSGFSYLTASDFLIETRGINLMSFKLVSYGIPLAVSIAVSLICRNLKLKQSLWASFTFALINTVSYPFLSLVFSCYFGVDCV
jgi:hypothetical protein